MMGTPNLSLRQRDLECDAGHNWVLVLAAGEGSRLQALTTTASGITVPKQFCSLHGDGPSLLHAALQRARGVAPPERICAVVAAQHRRWWQPLSQSIPAQNIMVQPRNRGTANGILMPLLRILQRDPDALLLVLPSDHHVRNEASLALGLRQALAQARSPDGAIVLLGLMPEEADCELGYIVPRNGTESGSRAVQQFVEKPSCSAARELIEGGGLWNAFIFAVRGQALLELFEQRFPEIVMEMRGVLEHPADAATANARLAALYERLPTLDFSRDVIERSASRLRVVTVPPCGWSDLGTPRRVVEAVKQDRSTARQVAELAAHAMGFLNLEAQSANFPATG